MNVHVNDAPTTVPTPVPQAWRAWVGPVAALLLLGVALFVLRRELGGVGYRQLSDAVVATDHTRIGLALGVTVVAYAMLCGYDLLALRYVGSTIGVARTCLASLLAYATSQTLGFPLLTGGAVRIRFWTAWGLSSIEIAQATAFVSATFIIGVLSVCGLALLLEPASTLALLHLPVVLARPLGVVLVTVVVGYVAWAWLRRGRSLTISRWTFSTPSPSLATLQVLLALCEWGVAGTALYVLLPGAYGITLLPFLGVFVLAQFAGILSHVPGGIGVFETLVVLALRDRMPAQEVVAALFAYRAIYYLLPFALALLTMTVLELVRQRERVSVLADNTASMVSAAGRWGATLQPLLPTTLGITTFIGGAILLFSGATPAAHGRARALVSVLPLGLIELSHFAASMVGVGLLVLGGALRRRLDAAWGLTVLLLTVGIITSLLKGLDWEEAAVLTGMLALVLPSRGAFYRKASLTGEPPSPAWFAAVFAVVGASVWLGLLSYRHVDYAGELWWEFAVRGNAPRFLRASAGALVALGALGLWRLLRQSTQSLQLPTADELRRAEAINADSPHTTPALALLGDKALLFNDEGTAYISYGVSGRSWVAMGDPVGPDRAVSDAAWKFKELADAHSATPVFYQVRAEHLPVYIELGLAILKVGEEALVPLTGFSLEGPDKRWMRRALSEAKKAGLEFSIVGREEVPALLPTFRAISDAWLGEKSTREKGFSLGYFDETYLARFPAAIVRAPDATGAMRIVAFANIWCGAPGGEVSPDLMRRVSDGPRGVMDFLFIHLILWAQAHGYSSVNLGMAPLSGVGQRALARPELMPLWSRMAALLYARGEHFYNFNGLRSYKGKYSPQWTPRFIAAPGGFALPGTLTNIASLIAGGLTGIVRR